MAERLAKHDLRPPKVLQTRPRLNDEQRYLARQFMVLHRTRGQGLNGPDPISLGEITHFLNYWPQWDSLKFVETMLVADQTLAHLMAIDREEKTEKQRK